jgi:hypothetical protein
MPTNCIRISIQKRDLPSFWWYEYESSVELSLPTLLTITVYYSNFLLIVFVAPQRLAGYSLYVSNSSTTKNDGYLCYHHEGPEIPPVIQNVNCNYLGQYVIFYNERNETASLNPPGYGSLAILELCYIEIKGKYIYLLKSMCTDSVCVYIFNG